jgi:hypothetical protein
VPRQCPLDARKHASSSTALHHANHRSRAWALARAADTAYALKDYRKANVLAKAALEKADLVRIDSSELERDVRRLRAKAANTTAHASKELGANRDAQEFRQIAVRNGSQKARKLKVGVAG